MIVTYTPDGGEKVEWAFKPGRMLSADSEAVERVTGMTFAEWAEALLKQSTVAKRSMLWVLRRQKEPGLKFSDVSFRLDELTLDLDADERHDALVELRKRESTHGLDADEEAAVAELVRDGADAEVAASGPKEAID